MRKTKPVSLSFPKTDIGKVANQVWKEQEELGCINVAKGRLCRKWGEAQGLLYKMHPDFKKGNAAQLSFGQKQWWRH